MNAKKIIIVNLIIIFLIAFYIISIASQNKKNTSTILKKDYQNINQNNQNESTMNIISFTMEEVAKHNSKKDCWLVIDGFIYDVTKFINQHVGGDQVIIDSCGKDATQTFSTRGQKNSPHPQSAYKKLEELKIGQLKK